MKTWGAHTKKARIFRSANIDRSARSGKASKGADVDENRRRQLERRDSEAELIGALGTKQVYNLSCKGRELS